MKRNSGDGRSFSLQLTASFMACMGALLAFISISLMTPLSSLLEKNAFERTKETVLQSVSTANVFIDRLLSTLYFATTVLPDSMDSGAAGWVEQMQMIKKSDSDIISIALFHRDGTLLGAVGTGDVSLDTDEVASSEWFQKALAWGGTSTYFSSPFVQHIFSGQRTFVIRLARSAFYQKEDRLEQGVVLMDVSYASFSRLIEGVALGKSGYVYLLDRGGEIIAHPKLQLIYNGLHEENLDEINRLLIGQGRDKVDGRERVLIAATLNQTRWRLVGVAYLDELLVLHTAFVHILTVVLICALLLSLAVATMMSYRLMLPIRHVADAIGRVESGNLSEGIPETGFREVRAISESFNRMLRRIRALMDQIVQEQEILMVSSLARLFRLSISRGRSEITVREELEQVRHYLIIQKMRFKNKFEYTITWDEAALEETTVKLIVQPMAENAINHAIDETQDEALHIAIHAGVTEEEVIFTIEDDGVGMPPEVVDRLLTAPAGKSGIGVKNVHERIRLTYGEPYGIQVRSVEDEGTCVTIRLPRRKKGDAV